SPRDPRSNSPQCAARDHRTRLESLAGLNARTGVRGKSVNSVGHSCRPVGVRVTPAQDFCKSCTRPVDLPSADLYCCGQPIFPSEERMRKRTQWITTFSFASVLAVGGTAHAVNPTCDSLPGTKIYVQGSSAVQPFIQNMSVPLSQQTNPVTLVYVNTGSC